LRRSWRLRRRQCAEDYEYDESNEFISHVCATSNLKKEGVSGGSPPILSLERNAVNPVGLVRSVGMAATTKLR
jgi:hypothetical protein